MEVDPEAFIKCTTILPGGVASTTGPEKIIVAPAEEAAVVKEEPVQIQIDEQSQITIKTAQNKMLADLLEKKSNPPVQIVQMTSQQMGAPTIQITETGQIVQVKPEVNPVIQINENHLVQNAPFLIKNDQGQIIQIKPDQMVIKNEQGQIIQLKPDQVLVKNEQGVLQVRSTSEQIDSIANDHAYKEPPSKKAKMDEKIEKAQSAEVSKTAANLYAALAASALEDEEDLLLAKQEATSEVQPSVIVGSNADNASVIIQEPILQVQQPTMAVQQPAIQMQQTPIQVQPPTMQVQQPMLQVQPMDVQNIIASQSGQLILQEKPIVTQATQFVQQPMQLIAAPVSSQGGISYITPNIQNNMMQKTIIIVQGATGGGPITLTVNNPGGLDEATLNSVIAQATEAITQQQIIQNTAQLTASQQPIITTQPQPHKAQIVNSTQQIVVTQKQPPALITTSASQIVNGNQIVQGINNQQIIQGGQIIQGQQIIQGNQQIIQQGNQQIIQGNQQIIQQGNQQIIQQGNQQIIQQGNQQIIQQGNQQIIQQGNQQIIQQGNQQIIQQGNQQIIVSNNQQILVNTPGKSSVSRVVHAPRPTGQDKGVIQTTGVTTPTQKPPGTPQLMRQVITRQPVMIGGTKIGDKELIVNQPVTEVPQIVAKPPIPKPSSTPPLQTAPQAPMATQMTPVPATSQVPIAQPVQMDDTPWICHWRGCGKTFENAADVFKHAARTHCPTNASGEAPCMWLDCDRVPRKTFALLNHLNDRHCAPEALKAVYASRRHITSAAEGNKPAAVGYPPDAALAALNKHARDFVNPRELMDENEGPVTKSIRLTAALILRNLVIYSNTGRRHLKTYEAHLATIALSNVEASRTVAQVLYDMNNI